MVTDGPDAALLSVVPASVRDRLVARHDVPPRPYHSIAHAEVVARHARDLGGSRACLLAAWFHDVVHDRQPGRDEARSAALLLAWLAGDPDVDEAARLVEVTRDHDPAEGDVQGAILSDADLAVLGADPSGYAAYRNAVRQEYADVDAEGWRAGRGTVLRGLLQRPRIFRTDVGAQRWEAAARRNLAAELDAL